MDITQLQSVLKKTGRYFGPIDGSYGPLTRAAVLLAMTDGPDTQLDEQDFADSAARLGVTVAHIKAITTVESSGAGFVSSRPVILFEPHRFSRATGHVYDQAAPDVSYPNWDRAKYPRTQEGRWKQLVKAVGLNVDAGFASASYGRFQILAENYRQCGYASPFDFACSQAYDEISQLHAFERFITSKGLLDELRAGDWGGFAEGYNGTAYKLNHYDERLSNAFKAAGGQA